MRIALDCEFSFDANYDFVCMCAAVMQEDGTTRTWWRDQMYDLKQYILLHASDTWVAHNVETAEGYLFQSLGLRPTKFKWHDTLLESLVAYNRCSATTYRHSLDVCLKREGLANRDHDEKEADQKICVWEPTEKSWEDHLAYVESRKEHLLEYCLEDTKYLLKLDDQLQLRLKTDERRDPYHHIDHDVPLAPERRPCYYGFLASLLSEISWRGIPMSPKRVKRLLDNAPRAIYGQQKAFDAKYPGSFSEEKGRLKMNTKAVRSYAAKAYGPNPPLTDGGEVSLKSEYLKPYKESLDPSKAFLKDYYYMSKYCRALSSFCKLSRDKNWLSGFSYTRNRIRPSLRMFRAATGRLGMQPKSGFVYTMGKPFRGLCDPEEGKVLVEVDLHSAEVGNQAYISGDRTMISKYENPRFGDYYTDLGNTMDSSITSKHNKKRKTYKIVSLMLNYGAGAKKLSSVVGLDFRKCYTICRKLKKLFGQYWRFVEKVKAGCNKSTPLWFSDGWRIHYYPSGKQTTLGNWPFQGVGAYYLRLILIECWKKDIKIVAPVHDAIVFECDESEWKEKAEEVSSIMKECSKRALGVALDVGEPEVTFHGKVNCHSELNSREDYDKLYVELKKYDEKKAKGEAIPDAEQYLHDFKEFLTCGEDGNGDLAAPWLDEDFEDNDEQPREHKVDNPFGKCYISFGHDTKQHANIKP